MKNGFRRSKKVVGVVVLAAGTLFLWNSVSTESANAQNVSATDQAAIDDLVIASRILASPELGILDVWGHVSVRSPTNPNHYFIPRYVSAGVVTTPDIIENDLDSVGAKGPRTDEYQERFINGEIYKARPDVMAVVHAHTPELVVFGVNSVPLHTMGSPLPIFDIRKVNHGMPGIITSPALGKALAASLGKSPAALMYGHGVAVTDTSLPKLVSRIVEMRRDAQIQMMNISLGGKVNDESRRAIGQAAANTSVGMNRQWEGWKAMITSRMAAERKPAPQQARSTEQDVVLANKMLASSDLGVLDELGEVSVRNPQNPNQFFITRAVPHLRATVQDVIEDGLDCNPATGPREDQRSEVYIHCSIYKTRPDVMAVVNARTPELVAFSQSSIVLRPVSNAGRFIGSGLPKFDIRSTGAPDVAINSRERGKLLAEALGNKPAIFLPGHGVVVVDNSLYLLASRAYDLRLNAQMQIQGVLLGGKITYVEPLPGADPSAVGPDSNALTPKVPSGSGGGTAKDRFWEYWRQQIAGSN